MADKWEIVPYIGVGCLRFGMSRSECRAMLNESPHTFRRTNAQRDTDAYDQTGLHLHFDVADRLRCILAIRSTQIYYQEMPLLNLELQQVLADLSARGVDYRYEDEGYWLDAAGFVLYAPDETVEAVTVFRKGYYEEEKALAATVKV